MTICLSLLPIVSFRLLRQSELDHAASSLCKLSLLSSGTAVDSAEAAVTRIAASMSVSTSASQEVMLARCSIVLLHAANMIWRDWCLEVLRGVDDYIEQQIDLC